VRTAVHKLTAVYFHELFNRKIWDIINNKFQNFPKMMKEELQLENVLLIESQPATEELLLKVHTANYFATLQRRWDYEGARLTVGGCADAALQIMKGTFRNALCFGVAAGHHAERNSAWGGTYASVSGGIMATLEEYRFVDGKKHLIRKYCPNTFCLWTSAEEPKITISLTTEGPKEEEQSVSLFKIKGIELEDTQTLDSSAVIIIADQIQNIVWIWKGKDSSRFEYAEATRHATKVKNDVVKKASAHIERINEGDEPENFPKL